MRNSYDNPIQIDQSFKADARKVLAVRVAMERGVQIGARVGDHIDPADLKFGARLVSIPRILAAQIIANDRRGKSLISDEPVLDRVAQVDVLATLFRHTPAASARPNASSTASSA